MNTKLLDEIRALADDPNDAWPPAVDDEDMRGLARWVVAHVRDDRRRAVAMARSTAAAVRPRYGTTGDDVPAGDDFLDAQLDVAARWVAHPSEQLQAFAFQHVDHTRQLRAWEGFADITDWWVLEACELAVICVWTGTRQGYVPVPPFPVASGQAVACAYRALVVDGVPRAEALTQICALLEMPSGGPEQ